MNYEKLTLDGFAAKLKGGGYESLAGARRAVGRTDWKTADKDKARAMIDRRFGVTAAAPQGTKTAPTKKASAKSAAPKKAASKKAAPKKAATKRSPRVGSTEGLAGPVLSGSPVIEEVTRQHAASNVISALRNSGNLTPAELRAYAIATHEYAANASEVARSVYETSQNGVPVPAQIAPEGVSLPEGSRPKISVPPPAAETNHVAGVAEPVLG